MQGAYICKEFCHNVLTRWGNYPPGTEANLSSFEALLSKLSIQQTHYGWGGLIMDITQLLSIYLFVFSLLFGSGFRILDLLAIYKTQECSENLEVIVSLDAKVCFEKYVLDPKIVCKF